MGVRMCIHSEEQMIVWEYQGYLYEKEGVAVDALAKASLPMIPSQRYLFIDMRQLRYLFPRDIMLISRVIEFAFAGHAKVAYIVDPQYRRNIDVVGRLYGLRDIHFLFNSEREARLSFGFTDVIQNAHPRDVHVAN